MTPVSLALLVVGYALAVPLTVWVPGFLRLWRRREPLLYAAAQGGAVLIVIGHALRGNVIGVTVNALWLLGFGVAYALEGRTRARAAA
jgi:hypothetical protein